jgi:hypothetical protein
VAGAYCNGGIMPLVGGELARAAFEHGFETYGVEILEQYHRLISAKGETYLWYFPDGTKSTIETSTSPDALPTDGWGSSAMLWALVEGLAGIVDRGRGFDALTLSPRWPAAGVSDAEVSVGYAASGRGVGYAFRCSESRITIDVEAPPSDAAFHVLLPSGSQARAVRQAGRDLPFGASAVESSSYVDFSVTLDGASAIEIDLQQGRQS